MPVFTLSIFFQLSDSPCFAASFFALFTLLLSHPCCLSSVSSLLCFFLCGGFRCLVSLSLAVFIPTVCILYTLQCDPLCLDLTAPDINMHPHMIREAIKLWWSMIICPTYPLKNWCRTVCLFPAPFSCPGWYRILTFHSINRVKKQGTRAAHQNHCTAGKQWFCWWHISVWSAARLNFSHHSGYHSWVAGDFTPFCGLACLRCSTAYIFIHLLFTGQGISASPSTFWTHNLALTAVKARLLQQHVACKCRVLLRACF